MVVVFIAERMDFVMYIIKNALRCISRSLGRNLLIGIIVLVIATSACVGLSIRQAADSARDEALSGVNVTATISFDRQSAMSGMKPPSGGGGDRGGFDRDSFAEMMGGSSGLTLEEYQTYAEADSVKGFYYSQSVSINGNDALKPVSNEAEEEDTSSETHSGQGRPEGMGGMGFPGGGFSPMKGMNSDFTLVGYSGADAMTAFVDGSASVTDGSMFNAEAETPECLISSALPLSVVGEAEFFYFGRFLVDAGHLFGKIRPNGCHRRNNML